MATNPKSPNLLVIVTDQHRHDALGLSSGGLVQTPHLDDLARQGQWFDHAYSVIPTCCPARQSMLRGKTAETFGAYWNYDITLPISTLEPQDPNWVKVIADVGYRCGYVGKWHVHPSEDPTDFGFERYYGILDYAQHLDTLVPNAKYENSWRGEKDVVDVQDSRTHVLASAAVDMIRDLSSGGAPWHLRLDFPEPHLPSRPAGSFAEMYDPAKLRPWASFGDSFVGKPFIQQQQLRTWHVEDYTWEDWAPIVARYYGIISQVDDAIGNVLSGLEEMGQRENTIIVFTSDHGDMCGSHGMVDKHFVMYDDVVRVPFVVAGPGVSRRSEANHSFVSATLDLAPTMLDLAGAPKLQDAHGCSLLPVLAGRQEGTGRNAIFSSYNGAQFGLYCQRMIRTKKWKYVWNLVAEDELYDMDADPDELRNRSHDPEVSGVLVDLRRKLYGELVRVSDPLLRGPWLTDQLLGSDSISELEIPATV